MGNRLPLHQKPKNQKIYVSKPFSTRLFHPIQSEQNQNIITSIPDQITTNNNISRHNRANSQRLRIDSHNYTVLPQKRKLFKSTKIDQTSYKTSRYNLTRLNYEICFDFRPRKHHFLSIPSFKPLNVKNAKMCKLNRFR